MRQLTPEKLAQQAQVNQAKLAALIGGEARASESLAIQRDRAFQQALEALMGTEASLLGQQIPPGMEYLPGYGPGQSGAALAAMRPGGYNREQYRLRGVQLPAFEAAKRRMGL